MSTELRKLLENAKGTTEHIIAIILDIRGFTPFCKEEESLNVANFIKRVYIRIMDDYFPKASFYKPTGDGLLIIVPYTSESLKDAVNNTMTSCLNLLENFGKLREGDDMIYFSTPDKIGIGISRGAACCISSEGTIIDYSGRVINLASRLNDFARPSGIVFDSKLGLGLLPKEMQDLFLCENVYIRGIAEDKPIAIYFTKQHTLIPPSRKEPLKEPEWVVDTVTEPYRILKESCFHDSKNYAISLQRKPLDEKQITLEINYLTSYETQRMFLLDTSVEGIRYINTGTKHFLYINYPFLMKHIDKDAVKDDTEVNFEVSYPSTRKSA
jgi:class 3 adenylate cyclase